MKRTILFFIFLALAAVATTTMAGNGTAQKKKFDCAATVNDRCETCHYKNRICEQLGRKNRRKWRATIRRMVRHGAILDKEETESLAGCLAGLKPGADICRP